MCAVAVLIIYSYVIYWQFNSSRLGFVNMIACLITDFILYIILNAKITNSSTNLCIAALLNRILLYCFGENYWIYGYIVIYLIYGVVLSTVIANKNFPFESAFSNIDIDNIQDKHTSFDVSRAPEFVLAFITGCYLILFVVLYVTEPLGVPLVRL
jgi:hypothetical protein